MAESVSLSFRALPAKFSRSFPVGARGGIGRVLKRGGPRALLQPSFRT